MEYTQISKQVIDFHKSSFSNWYDAVSMVQDQTVSVMDMVLDQSTWIPQEGRHAIQNWVNVYEKERGRFKSYVDEGYTGLEKYFSDARKSSSVKPKKS
ncbi:MAG: hypothetical protein GY874_15580 [Desulfobacteraceae bacterium]|nr:hypothetical protein [Desulfobacteraceae bacterium]